ncbi:SIR2 family protein [Empedobacter brevis]|uniref:SIR2 family protein n=1 Tax=Empedobacter brevis TaxID=247 RepID=UPI0028B1090E|nr:SIR2 family protein [Empedobacter brevis]
MTFPNQLLNKIKNNNIVVFVGAGLSIKSGYPSWNKLIITLLDGIKSKEPKSEKFKSALEDEILNPIEVLEKISQYKKEIIEVFYSEMSNFSNISSTTIHKKIGSISNKIITTNYDSLLEESLPDYQKIIYTNDFKVAKLSEIEKYIFKIHGDIQEPDKCILFPDEYEGLYSEKENSSVFELKKIISDKSILFIGFSLADPYINYVFDYINNLYSGFSPEHFIITTDNSKNWPNKITPVIIKNHDDLENTLDSLIKSKNEFTQQSEKIIKELHIEATDTIVEVTENIEFDSPPTNKFWVGRHKEILNIGNEAFRSIFITGIGGQGKSALASQYLNNFFDSNIYEFADWRDFKEESNRFQTKILSIIKRLSPIFNSNNLDNINNRDLVDLFFQHLGKRRIVFVFDNIDSYIDLVDFKPTGNFEYFFEQTLNREHFSKFIFTCRPFIREASVNFYQISLSGLSLNEAEELFEKYKISISNAQLKRICERAHRLTKGHPLWLNLIAGQAVRGIDVVNKFIDSIENKSTFDEDDFSAILSEKILNEVWISLNDKQKNLLRGVAETVKPENEENLRSILSSELNTNQFNRSLRILKNLNLIETLSDKEIELHPLVKEFILTKYPNTERSKFITLLVQYYDKFIYVLKPRLDSHLSLKELQNWTLKIELQINNNDFKSALISLEEVSDAILTAGFSEEYLRVSELLFNKIDWEKAISNEFAYFDSQFIVLTSTQTQMGKYEFSYKNLQKFKLIITGKSQKYLLYCSQMSYLLWYQELFDEAITVGEEGVYLLTESNLTDNYSLKHNYSLALRDSKKEKNIRKALDYFLRNEKLENVLNIKNINFDLSGNFYGNVGRCLELLERFDDSFFCYCVSTKILFKENNSKLNIGYACSWISNLLMSERKYKESLFFLKHAKNCWEKTSIVKAKQLKLHWNSYPFNKATKDTINKFPAWKIESYCKEYINEYFEKL